MIVGNVFYFQIGELPKEVQGSPKNSSLINWFVVVY